MSADPSSKPSPAVGRPRGEPSRQPPIDVAVAGVSGADLLPTLLDPRAAGGRVLKANPKREVFLVESTAAGPLVVKIHHVRGVLEKMSARLLGSRARREFVTARALVAAGVATPEPVACIEDLGRGFAASASRAIVDATPLGTYLERRFTPGDGATAAKREWVRRAIEMLAVMHGAGFDHRDFHGGNLLVDGADRILVIDLHRVVARAPSTRRRLRALADLLHTLRFALDPEDTEYALREYVAHAPGAGFGADSLSRLETKIARRERIRIQSRTKRCLVESSGFTAIAVGGCRGFRRRETAESEVFEAIAAATAQLGFGGPFLRSLARRSAVAIGVVPGDGGSAERSYAVKVYHGDGTRRARGNLTGGRGRRAWHAAHALDVRGIAAARPVAWIQTPDRSIVVTEEIRDAVPLHVLSYRLAGRSEQGEARSVALAVASLVGDLFASGAQVNDLSPKNVLVTRGERGPRAFLCDFDGVKLRPPSFERMIKALAQLNDLDPAIPLPLRLLVLRRLKRRVPRLARAGAATAIAERTARRSARSLGPRPAGALEPRTT